ncbi:MAG TPA: ABC transporter substrate-binding protein [bacterium]|nr:ABC transporter substrate-binding protein [bacterium]
MRWLVSLVLLVLLAVYGTAWSAPGNLGTLRVGLLIPETGYLAAPGRFMREGFQLYLGQHANKLGGREVQVFTGDEAGNPSIGLTQTRRLVEQDRVDVLFGPLNAAVGSALAPYINEHKIPALYPIVSADDLTQRKISPYIVRTGWTSSLTTQPLGDYAYKTLHYRKAATIAYDFEFGWQSVGGFVQTFQGNGGKVMKQTWTPQTTTDFSPYLSQIPRDVDVVFCSFSGSTAINFFQQYRAFGLKMPLVCQGNATDESTLAATGPSAVGVVTALQYSAVLQTPANQAFVAAYQKAYGHVPSYYGDGTYVGAMFLDRGLQAVHGDISDPIAFAKALRGITIADAPRGPVALDSYGNPIENVYIRQVAQVNGALANTVLYTYPRVSQFWTYAPAQFLAHPVYSRTYPPCNACGGK